MDPIPDSKPIEHPFLRGGGEMGRRVAAHDWRASPVGSIETWPQSLRTALSFVLNSGFPIYLAWGPDLIGFNNDAFLPILGNKRGLGVPFRETWSEMWEQVGPIAQRAMAGTASYFEDMPLMIERHVHLERAWFTFSHSPVRDEAGRVGGVLMTVVETTVNAQAQLRARVQLRLSDGLRGLDDPDQITEWACRVLGEHLDVRRAGYTTISGGDTINVSFAGWRDGTVPTVVGQSFPLVSIGPEVAAELSAGKTVRLADVHADPRTRAHTVIYEQLQTPSMLVVPLLREGRLIATVSVGAAEPRAWTDEEAALTEDVAERTRAAIERALAERALKQQIESERDRLRTLFDQAPTFIASLRGQDHVYELVNPAYVQLIGERDFIGRPIRDVVPETLAQGFLAQLDAVYTSGEPVLAIEASLLLEQGAGRPALQRYVDFIYQPIIEADGLVSGVAVIGSDVTERHRATEALRDADRRKDDFLAMLAHELRNPLAPISTAAQLLQAAADDPARVRHVATIVARQVAHMTNLLNDLLDVSRVTRGVITLDHAVLDFKSIVASAIEQVRPLIEARRHAVTVRHPAPRVLVRGDRTRLVQVLVNLLNNAAKYTPDGGHIEVSSEIIDGCVEVTVCDEGIGIAPGLLPHVFELFTQGERTPDRSHGGLGLGLALVRSLAELHGGRVSVASDGPGQGSRFTVTLPLAEAELEPGPGSGTETVRRTQSLRVMVVDDNIDAGETLADLLGTYGHDASLQSDAGVALQAAALEQHDAYVLDIGLPTMDGYELLARLKALIAPRTALFIAVTGYGQPADVKRARDAGFDHHLTKPADGSEIARRLAAFAARSGAGEGGSG
jgi:signal transduction histidine kinase/ActR/RegA family two-component response regulator